MYAGLTDDSEKLWEVAHGTCEDPDMLMKSIDKELKSIKFKAFGKVKEKTSKKVSSQVETLQVQKDVIFRNKENYNEDDFEVAVKDINEKLSAALLTNQRKCLEDELNLLKNITLKKGKSAGIFKLKDNIIGTKKAEQEATSLIHFQSGIELTNPKDIKDASLQYCVQLLSNREPREDYRIDCELKDLIHVTRMAEEIPDDINHLTNEMFEETYKALGSKVGKYEFIMKGGAALKSALLKVCQSVWISEKMPESWHETTLIQLYKGKG